VTSPNPLARPHSSHTAYPSLSLQDYTPEGAYNTIFGWADAPDSTQPAQLYVHLQGVPAAAPYTIFSLGPVINGLYDWALVSDPDEISLFVLARNVTEFVSNYETAVLQRLNGLGFNQWWNTPIPTLQTGCTYLPPPDFTAVARRFP
jgi:lipocalin